MARFNLFFAKSTALGNVALAFNNECMRLGTVQLVRTCSTQRYVDICFDFLGRQFDSFYFECLVLQSRWQNDASSNWRVLYQRCVSLMFDGFVTLFSLLANRAFGGDPNRKKSMKHFCLLFPSLCQML